MEHAAAATLDEHQLLGFLVALAITLLAGRLGGELARRVRQPEVLGELFAGLLLGPTFFGALAPRLSAAVFHAPSTGRALSAFSWVGAVLLMLVAGLEVDLEILAKRARPGLFAALGATLPTLVAGTLFARWAFPGTLSSQLFLGIVLSVTAVSVVAKILIEGEALRRDYAQVLMAAGIASEILVWPLVAVASSIKAGSPWTAVRAGLFAAGFLAFMFVLGKRAVFWLMRRVSDSGQIRMGTLSLVLLLALGAAILTASLGLHPLLGAFMLGVVLATSPRATEELQGSLQSLSTAFFSPIFFVTAGMRVDVLQLRTPSAWLAVVALFVVATAVKVGPAVLGARLGGLPLREASVVGVGVNLKGGTDVIVAIIGAELALLAPSAYAAYAVVALLTVLVSPPLLARLQRAAPPRAEEQKRLDHEEADRRSYLPKLERLLLPLTPQAFPELSARVAELLGHAKHEKGEILDVTELVPEDAKVSDNADHLDAEVKREVVEAGSGLRQIVDASGEHDLVALGARLNPRQRRFSFGRFQDAVIQGARADVLLVVSGSERLPEPKAHRVLVPVTGFEYSMAASDLGAFLAKGTQSELVLFHAISSSLNPLFYREHEHNRLREAGRSILDEVEFRVKRLGVRVSRRVVADASASDAIERELRRQPYDWLVLGGMHRGGPRQISVGGSVERVLTRLKIPALLLLSSGEQARPG